MGEADWYEASDGSNPDVEAFDSFQPMQLDSSGESL
jgi:hypothetical protein